MVLVPVDSHGWSPLDSCYSFEMLMVVHRTATRLIVRNCGPAHCKAPPPPPPSHAILYFCIPSFELLFSNCFNLLGRNKGTFVCTNLKSINFSFVFQVKNVELRKRGREKKVQRVRKGSRGPHFEQLHSPSRHHLGSCLDSLLLPPSLSAFASIVIRE